MSMNRCQNVNIPIEVLQELFKTPEAAFHALNTTFDKHVGAVSSSPVYRFKKQAHNLAD